MLELIMVFETVEISNHQVRLITLYDGATLCAFHVYIMPLFYAAGVSAAVLRLQATRGLSNLCGCKGTTKI